MINHWSGQQFEDAVTAKDASTAAATGTAADQVTATTDFETCQMTLPTPASFAAQGLPSVMYAAAVAHQTQHQYDYFQNKKNHAGDTWATRRTSEINAYNVAIAIEQKWVDQNCN